MSELFGCNIVCIAVTIRHVHVRIIRMMIMHGPVLLLVVLQAADHQPREKGRHNRLALEKARAARVCARVLNNSQT